MLVNEHRRNEPNPVVGQKTKVSTTKVPYPFAKKHKVLVQWQEQNALVIHEGPIKMNLLLELRRFLQVSFNLKKVSEEEFNQLLTQTYENNTDINLQLAGHMHEELDLKDFMKNLPTPEDLLESQDDAPIIRLLNAIFSQAIKQKASDIHLETFEQKLVIRFRIDGLLQEILNLSPFLAPPVISRIKVMAKLDIAEKRLPQDGRMSLRLAGHTVDVRVATMPSNYGERIVLRLLDKKSVQLDLNLLGMSASTHLLAQQLISHPNGIILVTGPTGSGKTTTLYAMLTQLNQISHNILTIEDPIEYDLPGIGQTQVNPKINLSFAKGLRAILRQDPDIVMVGEIRDKETVEIAIQASLTGHLVLSTLHTNSALGAITRLRDMGIEPFLIASTVIGVIGQRLIRLLCPHCKEAKPIPQTLETSIDTAKQSTLVFHAKGCEKCHQTGYSGRSGIYELIPIDKQLQKYIHENAAEQVMESYVRKTCTTLREDGYRRALAGETSIEEVLRVTNKD